MLAIGMTLILILRHNDLSVGYVAGFSGAIAAILMEQKHMNVWLTIGIVLLITRLKVPAFVATLAGMFIFRGLLNTSLQSTGTIIVNNATFNSLSNGFIPDLPVEMGFHLLTVLIGGAAIVFYLFSEFKNRANRKKYNFEVSSMAVFILKMVGISDTHPRLPEKVYESAPGYPERCKLRSLR